MANIALQRAFQTVVKLYPERYTWAEDIIRDFGNSDSTRNHAWTVLPSKILGPLPERHHAYCPKYSNAMSVFKKHGMEGIDYLLKGDGYSFLTAYQRLMRGDAIANYTMITGMEPDDRELSSIKEWTKYKRGKDLFIAGLGKFDIKDTIARLIATQQQGWGWRTLPVPDKIMAYGYFQTTDRAICATVAAKRDDPLLLHLVQYRQQWTPELIGRFDEVRRMYDTMGQIPNLSKSTPTQVMATVEEWQALRTAAAEATKNDKSPYKLTGERSLIFGEYLLSQVESPQELIGTGMYLDNCLAHYDKDIRVGNRQIWCLYKNRDLVGAGEFKLIGKGKHTWSQIRGKNNNRLNDEMLSVYMTALPLIVASL